LLVTLEFIQQGLESFQLFLLLQDNRHNNALKRPWASDHDPSLDVQLGAVKEPIEDGLIGFRESPFERRPFATFILNKLAECWKGLAHDIILSQWQH
jgi:hypothetical protein